MFVLTGAKPRCAAQRRIPSQIVPPYFLYGIYSFSFSLLLQYYHEIIWKPFLPLPPPRPPFLPLICEWNGRELTRGRVEADDVLLSRLWSLCAGETNAPSSDCASIVSLSLRMHLKTMCTFSWRIKYKCASDLFSIRQACKHWTGEIHRQLCTRSSTWFCERAEECWRSWRVSDASHILPKNV